MKILLLSPHFAPDLHAATGEVMTALATSLADQGHIVNVVTALPWYRRHDVEPEWRGRPWRVEKTQWGKIIRVWPFPTSKTNIWARALGFGGFTVLATAAGLSLGRPDVVMAMSPPILLGEAGWAISKIYRIPFVFNTQDIFPDVAVDLGALTNPKVIKAAQRHERSLYARADAVTVLSEDQASNVRSKMATDRADRVKIIANFVDLDRIKPQPKHTSYRQIHGLDDKLVVQYSGNVGLSQSFELIREAAHHYADRPEVHFVINGEGAARPEVEAWARPLANVSVIDFVPRDQVSEMLASADLHLILLKTGLARSSTPSKLYGILAAGRPVLASIDVGSEVATITEKAGAGLSVAPEDQNQFIAALDQLLADPDQLVAMGHRARSFVETWLTADQQAARYCELFEDLAKE